MEEMRPVVTGVKLSSVVPATVTGNNREHSLTAMDLALKLHYVRCVYFFSPSPSVQTLTPDDFKTPLFRFLHLTHPSVSGRIRTPPDSDGGGPAAAEAEAPRRRRPRPYVRCNDSGVRIVEASVEGFTVEEWLSLHDRSVDHEFLVHDQVLGPDLGFSPLVVLQMTRFKCGGISIGLNWAHVLGDAFSASAFMNMLGRTMAGQEIPKPVYSEKTEPKSPVYEKSFSIKKIEPVGDRWLPPKSTCKIGRQTFCLSSKQIEHLTTKYSPQGKTISEIEILYAVIWRSVLNLRGGSDPKLVTICDGRETEICSNEGMVISTVGFGGSSDEETGVVELATMIAERRVVENGTIADTVERDGGVSDFVLYGANLTFVNLSGADLYGFALRGEKSEFVNCTIHGVGDEGVVLVLPADEKRGEFAKIITIVMIDEELAKLKDELENYWGLI